MEEQKNSVSGETCNCGCYSRRDRYCRRPILRVVIAVVAFAIVFWFGVKMGEMRGGFGYRYGQHRGGFGNYRMMSPGVPYPAMPYNGRAYGSVTSTAPAVPLPTQQQ